MKSKCDVRFFAILAFLVADSLIGASLASDRNGFYVWQRGWSDKVDSAVRAEQEADTHALYFLGGELEFEGTNRLWRGTGLPASFLNRPRATTVLRLPVRSLDAPETSAALVVARARALGVSNVQLDADVPERGLVRYAALAEAIRRQWPAGAKSLRLGATFLPCHLRHADTKRVLSAIDEPVIQLHGLDAPKGLDEHWALMDRSTVFRALKEARALDARFKMALPSYAYVLTFHADGRFRRLYAEGLPDDLALPRGTVCRLAAPDLDLLCEVFRSPLRLPVIWFRLPVRGSDRWCLDRETLRLLERGERPEPRVETSLRRGEREGVVDLFVRYRHQIPLEGAVVAVDWGEKGADGEFFPLNGCRVADDTAYGALPRRVFVPPAPCGEWVLVGRGVVVSNKERKEK